MPTCKAVAAAVSQHSVVLGSKESEWKHRQAAAVELQTFFAGMDVKKFDQTTVSKLLFPLAVRTIPGAANCRAFASARPWTLCS
jgi:hypothetical protein